MILSVSGGADSDAVRRVTEDTRLVDSGRRWNWGWGWITRLRDLRVPDVSPEASRVGGFVNLTAGVVVEHLPGRICRCRGCCICREEVAEAAVDAVSGKGPFVLDVRRSVDSH